MTRRPKMRKAAKSKAIKGQPTRAEKGHPPELFHYTNLGALKGILASNELWATSAFHLNDSSEMQNLWPLLEDPLRQAFERGIPSRPDLVAAVASNGGIETVARRLSGNWIESVQNTLFGTPGREGRIGRPFVTSFTSHSGTREEDQYHRCHGMLSQWRAYAGMDGVALVFATDGLEVLLRREGKANAYGSLLLGDAVYRDPLKRFSKDIKRFCALAPVVLDENDEDGLILLTDIVQELIKIVTVLKHRAFAEENEHRIVAVPTPESLRDEILAPGDPPIKQIFHRRGATASIPYIRLFEGFGDPLPITRIIVGPSRMQQAVLEEVQGLVRGRGIVVQASEIPYVGSV